MKKFDEINPFENKVDGYDNTESYPVYSVSEEARDNWQSLYLRARQNIALSISDVMHDKKMNVDDRDGLARKLGLDRSCQDQEITDKLVEIVLLDLYKKHDLTLLAESQRLISAQGKDVTEEIEATYKKDEVRHLIFSNSSTPFFMIKNRSSYF
jgi:hypothetical protein